MTRKYLAWLLPLILAQTPWAAAQVALPAVRVPTLPGAGLSGVPLGADRLSNLSDDLSSRRLQELRRLRIRDLIRRSRREIEADPNGAPALRGEVVAFSPTDAAVERAREAGFVVLRERVLEGLDTRVVVFGAPNGLATRRALRQLRALDPDGLYDFNHIYMDSGDMTVGARTAAERPDATSAMPTAPATKVGLVDGGIDTSHAVFRDIVIHQHGCSGNAVSSAHGTAVASLMIGRSPRFHGASPGAELYAADVYCGLATGGAVDAVADAIAWLVHERVPVINVSLVGPPDSTLENVVRLVIARGHLIVAAVGNDGPAAPPLYPASYPDVIGVTAVDAHERALLEACRGRQVKFSAPGADMSAANPSQAYAMVRGTSFASPIVAGLLAEMLHEPDRAAATRAVADLAARAVDLGAPGPDPVYGFGLVGGDMRAELALAGNSDRPAH